MLLGPLRDARLAFGTQDPGDVVPSSGDHRLDDFPSGLDVVLEPEQAILKTISLIFTDARGTDQDAPGWRRRRTGGGCAGQLGEVEGIEVPVEHLGAVVQAEDDRLRPAR